MNIVVCIKQVPDVNDIKWTKENNLDRSQMLSKINKYDDWALDWAMYLKSKFVNVSVSAISMGPDQACDTLNYAVAKGCNRGILLCDKMFAASDTLATSKILARAIEKFIPDYNIILTGQMAQDGDTAQVPVSMSQLLNITDITHCIEIIHASKDEVIAKQKFDSHFSILKAKTPCLVAVKEECPDKYYPKIEDYIRAQNNSLEKYCFDDLELNKDEVGIIGSPTYVHKAFRPEINKNTIEIKENHTAFILDLIKKAGQ